jgi:hypothetical protein
MQELISLEKREYKYLRIIFVLGAIVVSALTYNGYAEHAMQKHFLESMAALLLFGVIAWGSYKENNAASHPTRYAATAFFSSIPFAFLVWHIFADK